MQKKNKKSKHGIGETACANPIYQKGEGGLDAAATATGWIRLPHKGPIPRRRLARRSGADQLHLYYTSEMDNLVLRLPF